MRPLRRVVLGMVALLALIGLALAGCTAEPPRISAIAVTPLLRVDAGWHVLGERATFVVAAGGATKVEFYHAPTGTAQEGQLMATDSTAGDGFTWTWEVPEGVMGHVWAKAYNRTGDSAQSELINVFRDFSSEGG